MGEVGGPPERELRWELSIGKKGRVDIVRSGGRRCWSHVRDRVLHSKDEV